MTQIEAKQVLLQFGINPNYQKSFPEKYLQACKDGKLELIKAFIALGVDINYKSKEYGESIALVKAAEGGHTEVIKFLMENGAIHDGSVDADGDTGLHTAVNWGQLEAVKTFVHCGASPNNLNKKKHTPLQSAIEHNHPNIFNFLKTCADPNAFFYEVFSFAHYCILNKDYRLLKSTFNEFTIQTNPNLSDKNGNNLLHFAMLNNPNSQIIDLLIENGADPNQLNNYGWTPYYTALALGLNFQSLSKNANPEIGKDIYEFYQAHRKQDLNALKPYLPKFKDALSPYGKNLIGDALENHLSDDWIFTLIQLGIDPTFEDVPQMNIISHAYLKGRIELAHKIMEMGVSPNHSGGYFGQDEYGVLKNLFNNELIDEIDYLHSKGAIFSNLSALTDALLWSSKPIEYQINFVKKLAACGANLNIKDNFDTVLGGLCNYKPDSYPLIKTLIECGADVDILDQNHNTPLILAIGSTNHSTTNQKVIELLLQSGASFDIEGGFGGNAAYSCFNSYANNDYAKKAIQGFLQNELNQVLKKYKVSSIQSLSQEGIIEFAATQTYGKLMAWMHMNEWKVAEYLIHAGISINPPQEEFIETPLIIAISKKNIHILELLLQKGANPNYHLKYDSYPIFYATNPSTYDPDLSPKILKILLDYGANPNLETSYYSVIDAAIQSGHFPIIQLLLEHGANLDVVKDTVLLRCLDKPKLFNLFFEKGANISVCDEDGNNLLMLALNNNHSEVLPLLIEYNDINHQNIHGETPLFLAVQQENEEAIKALLAKGADPDIPTKEGNSISLMIPYKPHLQKYFPDVQVQQVQTLSNVWEQKPLTPFLNAVYNRDIYLVETLIKQGEDINQTNYRGDTALMIALNTAQEDMALTLLRFETLDLTIQNELKDTALSLAIVFNYEKVKNQIEKKGIAISMDTINAQASLYMRIEKFRNAFNSNDYFQVSKMITSKQIDIHSDGYRFLLHDAVMNNNFGMAKTLLEIGAKPDHLDADFWDAFHYAEDNNNNEMLELLRSFS